MRGHILEAQLAVKARVHIKLDFLAAFGAGGNVDYLLADRAVEEVALAQDLSYALQDVSVLVIDQAFALKLYARHDPFALARFGNGAGETEPGAAELIRPFLHKAHIFELALVEVFPFDRFVREYALRFERGYLLIDLSFESDQVEGVRAVRDRF